MAAAVQKQLTEHVAPAWFRHNATVITSPGPMFLEPSDASIAIFDGAAQATALGWHTVGPYGRPFARVFVRPILEAGGAVLHDDKGGVSVATVLSHEIIEAFIDEDCQIWADGPFSYRGSSYALEIADPVQNDVYTVVLDDGQPVSVSNFVHPNWFDVLAPRGSQFDHMHRLDAPFSMTPGGCILVRWYRGSETLLCGPIAPPRWKLVSLQHPAARTARRVRR